MKDDMNLKRYDAAEVTIGFNLNELQHLHYAIRGQIARLKNEAYADKTRTILQNVDNRLMLAMNVIFGKINDRMEAFNGNNETSGDHTDT